MTVWPSCRLCACRAARCRLLLSTWAACCVCPLLLRFLLSRVMLPLPRPSLRTGTWSLLSTLCSISFRGRGGQGTTRIGLTVHLLRATFQFGSSVLTWRLTPSFAICRAAGPLAVGWTSRLQGGWSWSLEVLLARRGVLPGWNAGSRATGNGPRAVRSSAHLWGLLDLDAGERQQVALGNALLRTVVLFLAAARVYGFAAVMEHPQVPSWVPQAPSSWKLPELALLARTSGVESVHLDQCCCGTPWKKPTRLLAVGLPELGQFVSTLPGGGRCSPALGHKHVTLSGKGDDGIYRTAPAKTYNSVMCKVLADATFAGIARLLSSHVDVMAAERGLPAEIAMLHVPIDHYDPASWTAWTHDCARVST